MVKITKADKWIEVAIDAEPQVLFSQSDTVARCRDLGGAQRAGKSGSGRALENGIVRVPFRASDDHLPASADCGACRGQAGSLSGLRPLHHRLETFENPPAPWPTCNRRRSLHGRRPRPWLPRDVLLGAAGPWSRATDPRRPARNGIGRANVLAAAAQDCNTFNPKRRATLDTLSRIG